MATRLKTRIRHKIDIEENWVVNNPILKKGEIGFTSDGKYKNFFKIGDGETHWVDLQYAYSEFMANLIKVDESTLIMTQNGIAIKDTEVEPGIYGDGGVNNEDGTVNVPVITVNSKGQITSAYNKTVQVKQQPTMNVESIVGKQYTLESNYTLVAGKSTSTTINCIINVPKMAIGTQVVIKNVSPNYSLIVRTKSVTIDGFNGDITLAPFEYITIVSTSTTSWSIISESSRFDTTKLSTLALDSNIIVRKDTTGNQEQSISTMNVGTENIATI